MGVSAATSNGGPRHGVGVRVIRHSRENSTSYLVSEMPPAASALRRFAPPLGDIDEAEFRLSSNLARGALIGLLDDPAHHEQKAAAFDPWAGSLLFRGDAETGRTSALHMLGASALMRYPEAQIVVADLAGGELAGSCQQVNHVAQDLDLGRLTLLHDQLRRRDKADPRVLYLIDGVDLLWTALDTIGLGRERWTRQLLRIIDSGYRQGVAVAASTSTSVPELNRAFRHVFKFHDGDQQAPGVVAMGGGRSLKLYRTAIRLSHADNAPKLGIAQRPKMLSVATRLDSVPAGVDQVSGEEIAIDLTNSFAVLGPPRSGRTTTLCLLAEAVHRASGKEVPVVPSLSQATDLWSMNNGAKIVDISHGPHDGRDVVDRIWSDDLAPIIVIDDIRFIQNGLSNDFWMALERRSIRPVVAAFPTELVGAASGWRGLQRTYPNQLFLRPHLIGSESFDRLVKRPDAAYEVGSGLLRSEGIEREVTVAAFPPEWSGS